MEDGQIRVLLIDTGHHVDPRIVDILLLDGRARPPEGTAEFIPHLEVSIDVGDDEWTRRGWRNGVEEVVEKECEKFQIHNFNQVQHWSIHVIDVTPVTLSGRSTILALRAHTLRQN